MRGELGAEDSTVFATVRLGQGVTDEKAGRAPFDLGETGPCTAKVGRDGPKKRSTQSIGWRVAAVLSIGFVFVGSTMSDMPACQLHPCLPTAC